MTAILGNADGQQVWMAGDSAAVNGGWDRFASDERKVSRAGEMLIGCAGQKRISQVLRSSFVPPQHPDGLGDHEYLILTVMAAIRDCLDAAKSPMSGDEGGNAILIGYRGELYYATHEYACSKIRGRCFAVGSGGDLALGAFVAMRRVISQHSIAETMMWALAISAEHNLTVAEPFYVETI